MSNLDYLIERTKQFFDLHWALDEPVPTWKGDWKWQGSVPYHDKGGVYALLDADGVVVYVGVGISRGGGLYKDHGISRRLLAHVITTDSLKGQGFYKPQKQWSDVVEIIAIGFPSKYSYLALALEDYLIRELAPKRNISRKKID